MISWEKIQRAAARASRLRILIMPYEQHSACPIDGGPVPRVFRGSLVLLVVAMIGGQVLQHRDASPTLIAGHARSLRGTRRCPS